MTVHLTNLPHRKISAHRIVLAAAVLFVCAVSGLAATSALAQTKWGALAYNDRGATGLVWNRNSEEQAQQDAMNTCNKNATVPCKVLSGANHACLASTWGSVKGRRKAFAVARVGLMSARNAALVLCVRSGSSGCAIRSFMCADGSHKR